MTLDRFLSKEKSNGGSLTLVNVTLPLVNEPQLSTNGFHMKEG
jgi:hypothetical protein